MGTDIHGVFQRFDAAAGIWEDVPSKYEQDRHYQLFAVLAGVRNGYGFAGAQTAEIDPKAPHVVIDVMPDQKEKIADHVRKDKIVRKDRPLQQMVEQPHRNRSRRKRSLNQDLQEMVQRLPLKLSIGLIFLLELLFFACGNTGVALDETKNFEESGWIQKQPIQFEVNVADSLAGYRMYVVVRQNNAYPFYNLYFSPSIVNDQGITIQKGLAEAILYDPKTGKPKGAGFGDIYEKKFLIYRALHFPKPGKYAIYVAQSMRVDTLAGMVSFGIRLEKNDRK